MKRMFFSFTIVFAIILGFIFHLQTQFKILIPIFLAILMFYNFLKLEYKLKDFIKIDLLYSLVFTLGLFPAIFYFSTKNLEISIRIGLFLILITPTAIASPVVTKLIHGNVEFAILNTILYNFIAPLSYPLLLKIYFNNSGIKLSISKIFLKLVIIIFIPFFLSLIVKQFHKIKGTFLIIDEYIKYLFVILIFIIVATTSNYIINIKQTTLLTIISLTTIIALINYLTGFFIGTNNRMKKTLSVTMGQKNTGLCIIALSNFNVALYPMIYIPTILYIILHHLSSAILISIFSKNKTKIM